MHRLRLSRPKTAILLVLLAQPGDEPSLSLYGDVCRQLGNTVPRTTYDDAIATLQEQGLIERVGGTPSKLQALADLDAVFEAVVHEEPGRGGLPKGYTKRGPRLTAKGRVMAKLLNLQMTESPDLKDDLIRDLMREVVDMPVATVS